MSDYKVSVVNPEEAREVLSRLRPGSPENRNARREAILQGGIELKGSFEIVARDAASGEVAWSHKGENLITDFGRRVWMDYRINGAQLGFSSSTEPPNSSRCAISSDSAQLFVSSVNLTPTNNPVTHTKTFVCNSTISANYGSGQGNRNLGTIFLLAYNAGLVTGYARNIIAYALMTPPKTQTNTQTLEVIYKISMSPIY
jgi:hypothetical protein